MRAHNLLPDPAALGGDQPRGGTSVGGGFARSDGYPGRLCSPNAHAHHFARTRRAQIFRMTASTDTVQAVRSLSQEGYKYGFVTDIEADEAPPGLNEDTIRFISAKKEEPDWLLEWRLAAFRAWLKMTQPNWAKLHLTPIDYQAATYYSAPKKSTGPKSLDEVDPELLLTYEKLGIPLREHPELVRRYLGTVVPQNDNFFAALNSAVFSDGSFAYVPPGVRCPMELS